MGLSAPGLSSAGADPGTCGPPGLGVVHLAVKTLSLPSLPGREWEDSQALQVKDLSFPGYTLCP